ncbi:MAG: type II toxin-antitoxin system HicA family toxin [Candidatus Bathyarchaeia archaeon]
MDVIKALGRAGFKVTGQRGSHVKLEKVVNGEVTRITVPLHRTLKKGTLRRIVRDAGLTIKEFNQLL